MSRRSGTAMILAVLLWTVPGAGAQDVYVEDAVGDTFLEAGGQRAADFQHDTVDLVSVAIGKETQETMSFDLELVALEGAADGVNPFPTRSFRVDFGLGSMQYQLLVPDGRCPDSHAALILTSGAAPVNMGCVGVEVDSRTHTMSFVVAKEILRDEEGYGPRSGSVIRDAAATARELLTFAGVATYVVDRVPDEGGAPEWAFATTTFSIGDVTLTPLQQARYSNGGAGTVAFTIAVENRGARADVVDLTVAGLPSGWEVSNPSQVFLDAGETQEIPIIVTTPSRHVHGGRDTLEISFEAAGQEQIVPLTLIYLEVPQPAGHHPTLRLHTAEGNQRWMNTLEDDGSNVPAGPTSTRTEGTTFHSSWIFALEPGLNLGLQWQDSGDASVAFHAFTPGDSRSGRFSAGLYFCPGIGSDSNGTHGVEGCADPAVRLAHGNLDTELEGTPKSIELPMPSEVGGRSFSPRPLANLILKVEFASQVPDGGPRELGTRIDPTNSQLQLPLLEYLDEIDAGAASGSVLRIERLTPYEVKAPPATAAWAKFRATSEAPLEVGLRLAGHNHHWASIVNEKMLRTDSKGRDVLVQIDVPETAADGEFTELFLVAESQAGSAASKFRIVVDPGASPMPRPEADLQGDETKQSPPIFAVLAVILAMVLCRRR